MGFPFVTEELSALRAMGRYRALRRVSGPQDARILIEGAQLLKIIRAEIHRHSDVFTAVTIQRDVQFGTEDLEIIAFLIEHLS